MSDPECSTWKMWTGKEIEGTTDIGEDTLFIRSASNFAIKEILTRSPHIKRIWFCDEYVRHLRFKHVVYKFLNELLDDSKYKICLEVSESSLTYLNSRLYEKAQLYLKVPSVLKEGDFVCVGKPFEDEAFEIGKGAKVIPQDYSKDIKIL